MRLHRILALALSLLLSTSAFAEWQVQYQKKDGSWANSYSRSTEDGARSFVSVVCIRQGTPIKLVDTVSGKEQAFYCDPKTRKITKDGKPAPVVLLTAAEASERAGRVKRLCEGNAFVSNMTDCSCVVDKAKAELLQSEATVSVDAVLKKVSPLCVNRSRAYNWTYDSCAGVMKSHRPDYEQFCGCTADSTATGFEKNPLFNLRHYEMLRDAAMKQCGLRSKKS
jgi:hypothetical protein